MTHRAVALPRLKGPRVSVIIPVHNAAEWLTAAVDSVLRQTMQDLEVIIVDDASTDGSGRVAARLADRDRRVRCFRFPDNRGQAAARNFALHHARGAWVAPVDADDRITAHRLEVLCEAGEAGDATLIADCIRFVDPSRANGSPHPTDGCTSSAQLRQLTFESLVRSDIPLNGLRSYGYLKPLMRRDFLERHRLRYDERLRFAEDLNLYARALLEGARFMLHPQAHYIYNQTPVSASRDIRVLPSVAEQALENSRQMRALARARRFPELDALMDDHEQRWKTVLWFNRIKLALRNGQLNDAVRLTLDCPSSMPAVLSFARARARERLGEPLEGQARRRDERL